MGPFERLMVRPWIWSISGQLLATSTSTGVHSLLTSATSYRRTVSPERAAEILRTERGLQFDPRIVDLLLQVV